MKIALHYQLVVLYKILMKLDLNDLRPEEAVFELSEKPGKTFTLKKFSLSAQIWIGQRFGKDKIKEIFENQSLPEISEVAYYLLKDKTELPTIGHFQDCIVTQTDRISLLTALLKTIGISQPIVDKLSKEYDEKNEVAPPIGADTTT